MRRKALLGGAARRLPFPVRRLPPTVYRPRPRSSSPSTVKNASERAGRFDGITGVALFLQWWYLCLRKYRCQDVR